MGETLNAGEQFLVKEFKFNADLTKNQTKF